jgi:hypothetical protein
VVLHVPLGLVEQLCRALAVGHVDGARQGARLAVAHLRGDAAVEVLAQGHPQGVGVVAVARCSADVRVLRHRQRPRVAQHGDVAGAARHHLVEAENRVAHDQARSRPFADRERGEVGQRLLPRPADGAHQHDVSLGELAADHSPKGRPARLADVQEDDRRHRG